MNVNQFQNLLQGYSDNQLQFPIELAYGYTGERITIHIILFEDKLSRIETDSHGNVLNRIDQVDNVNMEQVVFPQKRFYPNRVNKAFMDVLDTFGLYVSVTNTDSKSEPIFEFGDILIELPIEQVPLKYFKDNNNFSLSVDRFQPFDYFLSSEVFGNDFYMIGDARKNYRDFQDDFTEITEEQYNAIEERWESFNNISSYSIERIWALVKSDDNSIIDSPTTDYKWLNQKRNDLLFNLGKPVHTRVVYGYVVLDSNHRIVEFENENQGFHFTHLDALLRMWEIKVSGMESEDKFFMSINDEETEKYWIYRHSKDSFEDDKYINLWAELMPSEVIEEADKDNFKEIKEFEYQAILHAYNNDAHYSVRELVDRIACSGVESK